VRLQRRHLWAGLAALLALALGYRILRPDAVRVEVATAQIGPLQVTVGDEGRTRARQIHLITAPVAGRLDPITLRVGDSVLPGMVVAQVAPLPLDARNRGQAEAALGTARDRARMAEANVEVARSTLRQAQRDHQRAEELHAAGAIALAELERLELAMRGRERDLEVAAAQAEAATHDVAAARAALLAAGAPPGTSRLALTCPIGGQVFQIPARSGRTVQAGELLLTVGDPADMEVVVDLLSSEAVQVKPGQRMLVTGWGGDGVLEGIVRQVEPAGFTKVSALGVEEQRVNVIGELVERVSGMGDGYRLDVRMVLWEADSLLTVPSSALFRRGEQWMVFIVEDGRARERPVSVGHISGSATEVTAGVGQGVLVIRHPNDLIRDGTRVAFTPPD
jgi:HlyD family secretion protein